MAGAKMTSVASMLPQSPTLTCTPETHHPPNRAGHSTEYLRKKISVR